MSGTGALRLAKAYLRKFLPPHTAVYIPDPTWQNHVNLFTDSGFHDIRRYRYFAKKSNSFDFQGALEDLEKAPKRSVVLFHACAHNPTGIDPTIEQWQQLSKVCKKRDLVILFDSAYQGFASGDAVRDSQSYMTFINDGHNPLVCQSFAKNFGLYGERVGSLSIGTCDDEMCARMITLFLQLFQTTL